MEENSDEQVPAKWPGSPPIVLNFKSEETNNNEEDETLDEMHIVPEGMIF